LWQKVFGDGNDQMGVGVASDGAGDAYAFGKFSGNINLGGNTLASAGLSDVWLAKWNAAGAHQWSKGYGDSHNQSPVDVAVDGAGAVYFGTQLAQGTSVSFGGASLIANGADFAVAKLDAAGNHAWSKLFGDAMSGAVLQ